MTHPTTRALIHLEYSPDGLTTYPVALLPNTPEWGLVGREVIVTMLPAPPAPPATVAAVVEAAQEWHEHYSAGDPQAEGVARLLLARQVTALQRGAPWAPRPPLTAQAVIEWLMQHVPELAGPVTEALHRRGAFHGAEADHAEGDG